MSARSGEAVSFGGHEMPVCRNVLEANRRHSMRSGQWATDCLRKSLCTMVDEGCAHDQEDQGLYCQQHPQVTHRTTQYMCGFASGLIFAEVMRRADRAGNLNYDGMIDALKT